MCGSAIKKVVQVATLGLVNPDGLKAPSSPNMPGSPDAPPGQLDPAVLQAREDEKRRRAMAVGQSSTILTGAGGLTSAANTGQKTLLGA